MWFHSLLRDAVFGWRQLLRKKTASAAAILSLALAAGSVMAAFELLDALLLRPLPVAAPQRLYAVAFEGTGVDGRRSTYDSSSYPMFQSFRDAVRADAECLAVSYEDRVDLTFGSDDQIEKAWLQYVSGRMFAVFGLRPAAGRLLTEEDDLTIGAHPVAVLSYDYWTRRLARDPHAVGRAFRLGDRIYQIVGVGPERFTGTETGTVTDIFVPMAMKDPVTLTSPHNFWLRSLVEMKPAAHPEIAGQKLPARFKPSSGNRPRPARRSPD